MGDSYGSTAYDYVVSEEEAISAVRTPPNCEVVPVAAEIPAPPSPLESYEGQDWNKDFQAQLTSVLEAEHSSELSLERSVQLRQLCSRFAETASEVAVKIIEELHMPLNRRTIPPLDSVGGVAGGEKYLHSGIFFKLSRDWKGIYGGDGNAMKAAEHELKGGMAYLDCRIVNLRLPLMALIRFRGHCLLAESIIPVNKHSLIYGSKDGGIEIFSSHSDMNEKIRLAAKHLNLKAHRVWNRSKTKSTILHAPIDLEGHIGRDGLFYVIDTARVFPPVAPVEGSRRGSYLYKLFRPEFVRLNPVPLSSDAYSKFGKDAELEHNEEVLDATIRLEGQTIPDFAKYLDIRYYENSLNSVEKMNKDVLANGFEEDSPSASLARHPYRQLEELSHLVAEMHLRGINMRYALAIHSLLSSTLISRLILTEVVARSAKHLIDDLWRGLDCISPEVYLKETAIFFSTMFSLDSDSAEFWNSVLAAEVDERFKSTLRSVKTPNMSRLAEGLPPPKQVQGFGALRNSDPTFTPPADPTVPTTSDTTGESRPLRLSNPRNQIRTISSNLSTPASTPQSSLNSDTCLNAVDGNLLRKGVDPTLLFFRICQLCGIELDFLAWNLPAPPVSDTPSSFSLKSSSSLRQLILTAKEQPKPTDASVERFIQPLSSQSDMDDSSSVEGSHEDSLASVWARVEQFFGTTWSQPLPTTSDDPALLKRVVPPNAISRIVARTKYLNRISYEEGTALSRLALSKTGYESFELLMRANRKFRECLEIKPDDSRALLNWALVLTKQAELLGSNSPTSAQLIGSVAASMTASALWKEAFSKYERALVLRPTDWRALTNWGTALSSQASRVQDAKEGMPLFRLAIEKFDLALQFLPFSHFHTIYNSANARLKLARLMLDDLRSMRTVRTEKAQQVYRECANLLNISISRFRESLEVEGTNVNAMHNLAVALATQARIVGALGDSNLSLLAQIAERDRLYQSAYLIYQRAIHLVPTSVDIYYGWGNALFRHALARREGVHADSDSNVLSTMYDAATRYQASIIISQREGSPFSRDAFINFGNVLMLSVKIAHKLKMTPPKHFMDCCSCYINLVDQPHISEAEFASISQVLLSFKRYLPKSTPDEVSAKSASVTALTPLKTKNEDDLVAKATHLLSEIGDSGSGSEGGNVLSGSGGSSNYEQGSSRVELFEPMAGPKRELKKKSKMSPTTTTSPAPFLVSKERSSPKEKDSPKDKESTSTASPVQLQRKKSAKSLAFDSSPKSSSLEGRSELKSSVGSELKDSLTGKKSKTSSTAPKLELSKFQLGGRGGSEVMVTPPTSPPTSPPAKDSPEIVVDSLTASGRRGTGSKIKQALGSFFGIRSKSPSSSQVASSTGQLSSPTLSSSTPGIPQRAESSPISPKSREQSEATWQPLAVPRIPNASNTSPSPLAVSSGTAKSRSKKKPARSLSNIEEVRPRAASTGNNSSATVTTSSSSSRKEEVIEEQASTSSRQTHAQLLKSQDSTSSIDAGSKSGRNRRKSDADSHIPLRHRSVSNIVSPSSKQKSGALAQSSPTLPRSKVNERPQSPQGDYSSISGGVVYQQAVSSQTGLQSHQQQYSQQNAQLISQQQQTQQISQQPVSQQPSSQQMAQPISQQPGQQYSHQMQSSSSPPPLVSSEFAQGLKQQVGSLVSLTASGGATRDDSDMTVEAPTTAAPRKSRRKSMERKDKTTSTISRKERVKAHIHSNSASVHATASTLKKKLRGSREVKSSSPSPPGGSSSSSSSSALPTSLDWSQKVLYSETGDKGLTERDFIVRGVLGTSRSGLVFVARKGEEDCAMKVRLPEVIAPQRPKMTPIFDNPFFVKLKTLLLEDSKLIMTFNLVRGPQLLEYVIRNGGQHREGPRLDHLVFNLVAAQLVSAFSYLSDVVKIPYRDFKPSNVLINGTGNIILTAHCEEDQMSLAFSRADVSFLAPEVVLKIRERRALAGVLGRGTSKTLNLTDDLENRIEDIRASWWMLGVYLLVIATGSNPFHSEDQSKVEDNVLRKRFSVPTNLGKLSSLLSGLLDRDITSRLCSAEQVRKHPYFHNVDWKKLAQLDYHSPFLPNIPDVSKKNILSESSQRSSSKAPSSIGSSSMDASLELSSTAGQISLMNTMVMPDVGNQLEGNTIFIQNTSMIEDQMCASSSVSSDSEDD